MPFGFENLQLAQTPDLPLPGWNLLNAGPYDKASETLQAYQVVFGNLKSAGGLLSGNTGDSFYVEVWKMKKAQNPATVATRVEVVADSQSGGCKIGSLKNGNNGPLAYNVNCYTWCKEDEKVCSVFEHC